MMKYMRKYQRGIAILLLIIYFIPQNVISVLGNTETFPLEAEIAEIDNVEDETKISPPEERDVETIEMEPQVNIIDESIDRTPPSVDSGINVPIIEQDNDNWSGLAAIYWNPGGYDDGLEHLDYATSSYATATNAGLNESGSDHQDGLTPGKAVESLNTAIRKAEKLSRQMEIDTEDVIIYAMKPMIVSQDTLYTVRGKGVTVMPWGEREFDSDLIFIVEGGCLNLSNIGLRPEDGGIASEDADLIFVTSGSVQLGDKVESYGTFVLDYTSPSNNWEWSSPSEIQASAAEAKSYLEPVIELTKRFDTTEEYLIDLIVPDERENVTAVKSLYSDDRSPEDFMDAFTILDREYDWRLIVEERVGGVVRDTTEEIQPGEATQSEAATSAEANLMMMGSITRNADIELTQKTIVAARTTRDLRTVYWNPGSRIVFGPDDEIPEGNDTLYSGLVEVAPVKTFARALEVAGGGRIVCMQTIDLSTDASAYLPIDGSGNYLIDGVRSTRVTLSAWSRKPMPILKIPNDQTVIISNMNLLGLLEDGGRVGEKILICQGGQLILERNVKMPANDPGYIQIDLDTQTKSKDNPIIVNDREVEADVFFTGINQNLEWRYLDVVIAGANLLASEGSPDAAGNYLSDNIRLSEANHILVEDGGSSQFAWVLRKDEGEGDGIARLDHLELYTSYYYDGVYIDGKNGYDDGVGATCIYPVKTFERAKVIWQTEMQRSLDARQEAFDKGQNWQRINLPKRFYICDTIPVTGEKTWELPSFTDIDGSPIQVEIVTHLAGVKDDDGVSIHDAPDILIHVSGSMTKLTLGDNIYIRNAANKNVADTYGLVVDEGAKLILTSNADISGLSLPDPEQPLVVSTQTLGTHILLGKDPVSGTISSGELEMTDNWLGSIHHGQYGIYGYGAASKITMNNGSVTEQRNKYTVNNANHDTAGIYLNDGTMVMSGGTISNNHANLSGAGVYLDGNASFTMTKGVISGNKALHLGTDNKELRIELATARGVGVHVGGTSTFIMGEELNTDHTQCVIKDQHAAGLNRGVGVYVAPEATFTFNSGTISNNKGRASIHNNLGNNYNNDSQGGGICSHGTFLMKDGIVTGNGWTGEWNDDYLGGGIFLSGTSSKILGGTISKNYCRTWGGGIAIGDTGADVEYVFDNILIDENSSATHGGGLTAAKYTAGAPAAKVKITNSIIKNNVARNSAGGLFLSDVIGEVDGVEITGNSTQLDHGGGLYAQYTYATTLAVTQTYKNCYIEGNTASQHGGGVFINGNVSFQDVVVKDNTATRFHGGGIYVNSKKFHSSGLEVLKNKANQYGGGIYINTSDYEYHYDMLIDSNQAMLDGGGIYTNAGSPSTYTNVKITNNTAGRNGGGIFKLNGGGFYLSETVSGAAAIYGNQAVLGGGIYVQHNNLYLDIAGPIQNEATTQGHNLYIPNGISTYLMQGEFLQPANATEGMYSVYIASENRSYTYINPHQVHMPGVDSIYINSPDNWIYYLQPASETTPPNLGISVNPERFTAGNIIIRPTGKTTVVNYTLYKASADGLSNASYLISYPACMDVATAGGLNYTKGGKLPPRTIVAGADDPDNSNIKNIVLLGKGVYLDGDKGSDDNFGSSPDDAVKTFAYAKQILIENTDLSNSDASDVEGFPPFIYICGTVTVASNATWDITPDDLDESRFTTSSKYRAVEIDEGRIPELPQVKRYTGFLNKPLVKVTGSGTTLTIPNLIMDGMMHSVDKVKQGNLSFMFEVTDGTLVLQDKANIRNNNLNMIKVLRGRMEITSLTPDSSDPDGFKNRQIELTRGDGVDLDQSSVMTMTGDASIIFLNKPEGMAGDWAAVNSSYGRAIILRGGSDLTMSDQSKIVFGDKNVQPNSSLTMGVVMGNSNNIADKCVLLMKDEAMITRTQFAIMLSYYNVDVTLQDDVKLKDNVRGLYGDRAHDGASIVLNNRASIYSSGDEVIYLNGNTQMYNMHGGIEIVGGGNVAGKTFDIQMLEDSSIKNTRHGIYFSGRANNINVELHTNASITDLALNDGSAVEIRSMGNQTASVNVALNDDTLITGANWTGRGVFVYDVYGPLDVSMHDNASMNTINEGIRIQTKQRFSGKAAMYDQTNITSNAHGLLADDIVNLNAETSTTPMQKVELLMTDDSWLRGRGTGVGIGMRIHNSRSYVEATMKERSQIYDYNEGVRTDGMGARHLVLISDDAWIGASATGAMTNGIVAYHNNNNPYGNNVDLTDYYQFKITDRAQIGGNGDKDSNEARRGVIKNLFYSNKPVSLELSGEAKMTYAGEQGIYINSATATWINGTSKVKIEDQAILSNTVQYAIVSHQVLPIEVTVGGHAAITNTAYGIDLREHGDAKISVLGAAQIEAPTNPSATYYAIKLAGEMVLDGTATIDGIIYLREGDKPITLTAPVPSGDPINKYRLRLVEGYVGQIVVKPDGTNVTNVTPYRPYFIKEFGEGMAAVKDMVNFDVNIILEGEKNVYLAINGSDSNNGVTPATAVRTFKKAKELLQTGNFGEGSNIIICHSTVVNGINVPVTVLAGDEDWSFDTGGLLTNTANGNTWKPIVTSNDNFWGRMIDVNPNVAGAASHVTFKNITIDSFALKTGNSNAAGTNWKPILSAYNKGIITLGDGAILQNVRTENINVNNANSLVLGVYIQVNSKLIMDGGIIKDLLHENLQTDTENGIAIQNEGTFEFISGSIENCKITQQANNRTANKFSIVLNRASGRMVMTGGSIQNNEIIMKCDTPTGYSSALAFVGQSTALISNGFIINNKGGRGSGLYMGSSGKVELQGGRIRGNTTTFETGVGSTAKNSPVYVAHYGFTLKGGGCVIDDPIYLSRNDFQITLSNDIYQVNRRYKVYLNVNEIYGSTYLFTKGSAVVQPDGQDLLNATPYLLNFELCAGEYILDQGQSDTKLVGNLNRIENKCLILMKAVYLDSVKGNLTNDGKSPQKAVSTFAKAKDLGEGTNKTSPVKDYFVIYISGTAKPADNEVWQLANISYMCRYTGFNVYDVNGAIITPKTMTYRGYLVEPIGKFTLNGVRIYGRRAIDTTESNGESLIRVMPSTHVILSGGLLSSNTNQGTYQDEHGRPTPLSMKGGAVTVEVNGILEINDIVMTNALDSFKAAIYQKAEEVNGSTNYGHVILKNSPCIEGGVYLSGKMNQAQAYLSVDELYVPKNADGNNSSLRIYLENDYNERPVIQYLNGFVPGTVQMGLFTMDDSILAIYDITNRNSDPSMIELQLRQVLYIDGQSGNDGNSGSRPDDALQTFHGVYSKLGSSTTSGANVYVVDTIEIPTDANYVLVNEKFIQNDHTYYRGTYSEWVKDASGNLAEIVSLTTNAQVYFKRYSQPYSTTEPGFLVETHMGSLVEVNKDAKLTLNGIYLDGHSEENVSRLDYLKAPGVAAEGPLVTVNAGGYLEAGYSISETISPGSGQTPQIGQSTETLFTSNKNVRTKTKVIGQSAQGNNVTEGIAAGIEILSDVTADGKVVCKRSVFRNLSIADNLYGGSDIYQNGNLLVQEETMFYGSVFLEGLGDVANQSDSRFMGIGLYGKPLGLEVKVLMRDSYNKRPVIVYPSEDPNGPPASEVAMYGLASDVNDYYKLKKRPLPQGYIVELVTPQAVYVDGQAGDDINNLGLTPAAPVRSMKRAYQLLSEQGGKVIYIVNTVDIDEDIMLTSSSFTSITDNITLQATTDHVDIRRYVMPLAGDNGDPDYQVDDFEGTLFRIKNGSSLILKEKINVDGHHLERRSIHDDTNIYVNHQTSVRGPLFEVAVGAELVINEGVSLSNNHNNKILTGTETRVVGGAIYNQGLVELNGGIIQGNDAADGAGIYQDGTFEMNSSAAGLRAQEVYLTTVNTGTETDPVWGVDRIIDTTVWIEAAELLKLELNMDHAVPGRPVVKYLYDNEVDPQYEYYQLGQSVPETLYLVESTTDDRLLELQNWRVLDVTVPKEIFLAVQQRVTSQVRVANAQSEELNLGSPEYVIKNNGRYDAKVSISGFANDNTTAGITYDPMTLVEHAADAVGSTDLYLAIVGSNTNPTDPFGSSPETSLYNFDVDGVNQDLLGILEAGDEGQFKFVGMASKAFISKYQDPAFPFAGPNATAEGRMAHLRNYNNSTGETSGNHARAKYKMTYRIEIIPVRR